MELTPQEIATRTFTSADQGFDPEEVRDFLGLIGAEMSALVEENRSLEHALKRESQSAKALRAREQEVLSTLAMAQSVTEELRGTARREADLILGEARLDAQAILSSAYEEHRDLLEETQRLKALRIRLVSQLRVALETHGRLLAELEADAPEGGGG